MPNDDQTAMGPKGRKGLLSTLKQFGHSLKANIAHPLVRLNLPNFDNRSGTHELGGKATNQDASRELSRRPDVVPSQAGAAAVRRPSSRGTTVGHEPPPYDPPPPYSQHGERLPKDQQSKIKTVTVDEAFDKMLVEQDRMLKKARGKLGLTAPRNLDRSQQIPPLPKDWRSKIEKATVDEAFDKMLVEQDRMLKKARGKLGLTAPGNLDRSEMRVIDPSSTALKSSQSKSDVSPASRTAGSSPSKPSRQKHQRMATAVNLAEVEFTQAKKVTVVGNAQRPSGPETSKSGGSKDSGLSGDGVKPRPSLAELYHERPHGLTR